MYSSKSLSLRALAGEARRYRVVHCFVGAGSNWAGHRVAHQGVFGALGLEASDAECRRSLLFLTC